MQFNKLYNDDTLKILKSLPQNSLDMIWGDPDYNVGINYNGSADGNTHYQRHYNSAARRRKHHTAVIHSQRYNAHYKAGHGGADEDILNGQAVFKAAVYKYEVEHAHSNIAADRADGGAVYIYSGNSDDKPVDRYLDKAAGDDRIEREPFLSCCLKNGGAHQ